MIYDPMEAIDAMRREFFDRCKAPPPPGLTAEQGRVYNRAIAQAETSNRPRRYVSGHNAGERNRRGVVGSRG